MTEKMKYAILFCVMSMVGCASTQQFVPKADIKSPSADKALIQVQRKGTFLGGARSITVEDNGKPIGEVSSGESLTWERPEGYMKLSLTPSLGMIGQRTQPFVQQVKAGNTYKYSIIFTNSGFVILGE